MIKYISKILKKLLPEFLYLILRNIYFSFLNPIPILIIYFIKSLVFNKKIKIIDKELILIAPIQRSGGTLLSQLFDNHSELFNYPSELILTKPKWDWDKNLNFSSMATSLKRRILSQNYDKLGAGEISYKTRNKFIFNPFVEKKIFKSLKGNSLRSKFNAYFTAFFNSFINYNNNNNKKKFITAFLPRFIMIDKNIDLFFQIYPNGKLICIIRDPRSWLISAKKHSRSTYEDTLVSLELWKKSCENSLKYKNKYFKKIILIKFYDLIKNTENTMRKICLEININFEESLLLPTFNGNFINSDSSHKSVIGQIDKSVLNTKANNHILYNDDLKILEKYESWFQDFIKKIG